MKKLISVMLVLCMVLALVPAMAFAADGDGVAKAQVDNKYFDSIEDAIAYAGVDGHSSRIDLVADDEDPGTELVIDKNIQIQLNGHVLYRAFIIESKATVDFYGPGTLGNGLSWSATTVYNHGTVNFIGGEYWAVMKNFGTMTFSDGEVGLVCEGSVQNNPDGKHANATVTVNGGSFILNGASYLFLNYGSVTLNGGLFSGKLHKADTGAADVAPVVNGGVYTDADVLRHRSGSTPVAGIHNGTNSDGTLYDCFMVGGPWIKAYVTSVAGSNVDKSGNVLDHYAVDFLLGDVKLDDMPGTSAGIYYYDAWKGAYTAWGDKVFNPAADPRLAGMTLDGRGLVNGLSDFTIVAKKVDGIFSASTVGEQVAADLLVYNQKCVKSVSAAHDRTNANEVWFTVTVTVDTDLLTPFSNPYAKYGNLIGPHKWIPIAIGFKGLNNDGVVSDLMAGITSWNMITTGSLATIKDGTTYIGLWVSGDHNDIGGNAGFEFVDTDTNILYHVDVVVKNENAGINAPSEPDDKDNAETYPGDGKDKPAASGSTTAPSGTGAGDGPAKTGDNSTVMLWATLMVASAAGVAICIVDEAKKRSHK